MEGPRLSISAASLSRLSIYLGLMILVGGLVSSMKDRTIAELQASNRSMAVRLHREAMVTEACRITFITPTPKPHTNLVVMACPDSIPLEVSK